MVHLIQSILKISLRLNSESSHDRVLIHNLNLPFPLIESGSETLHKICQLHCGSPLFCRNQVCLFLTSVCFLCILAVWGRCLSYWEIWHSSKSESLYKSHTYNVIVALLCWTSCTLQDFCSKTLIFWASSPAKPPTLYVCNGKEITVRIWGAIQHSSGL